MFRRLLQNKGLCSENLQQLLPDTGDQVYSDASCSRIADMLGTDVNTVMSLKGLLEKVQLSSMSTSYSGIDAPGVSVLNLLSYAQEELAMTVTHPEHVFAIEWNKHCQHELLVHPSCPSCLFGDLEEFLSPMLRSQIPELLRSQRLQPVLEPLIREHPSKAVTTFLSLHVMSSMSCRKYTVCHIAALLHWDCWICLTNPTVPA